MKSILAFDLDMQELDTSRCSPRVATGRVRKWQLSAEGNADILRLLSETLDDQVVAAVQNVSGRCSMLDWEDSASPKSGFVV